MRNMFWLITIPAAAVIVSVVLFPTVSASVQRCSDCHTGSNLAGGYAFVLPSVTYVCPPLAPPNATFNVSFKLDHPGGYIVKQLEARLTVLADGQPILVPVGSRTFSPIPSSGGSVSAVWTVTAPNVGGTLRINLTVGLTARYRHTTAPDCDEKRYSFVQYSLIDIRPVAIYSTAGQLSLGARAHQNTFFELVSVSRAQNITLSFSPNAGRALSLSPGFIAGMEPGERRSVSISVVNGSLAVDNGRVDLIWENQTGARDSSFLIVNVGEVLPSIPVAAMSPLVLTGRITGMLSLGLLVASFALGLVHGGGQRRVRVHCAVAWFLLGLSVYHGLMLVWGPFSTIWLRNWIVLGYVSAATMGASSINGLLRGWMTARFGHRTWVWIHRITIIAAIFIVSVHALLIGTDLAFIRDRFQPDAMLIDHL
jgi:hypothetical protein